MIDDQKSIKFTEKLVSIETRFDQLSIVTESNSPKVSNPASPEFEGRVVSSRFLPQRGGNFEFSLSSCRNLVNARETFLFPRARSINHFPTLPLHHSIASNIYSNYHSSEIYNEIIFSDYKPKFSNFFASLFNACPFSKSVLISIRFEESWEFVTSRGILGSTAP